jgi:DNA-binding CsgD family transcriptional regulator
MRSLRDRYASLSHRERQVMALVVSGLLNKEVGAELAISEITVKAHRGQVMRKMKAESFADFLDYHLKTGHTLSVQNRPTGLAEDVIVLPCCSVRLQGLGLSP